MAVANDPVTKSEFAFVQTAGSRRSAIRITKFCGKLPQTREVGGFWSLRESRGFQEGSPTLNERHFKRTIQLRINGA